MGGVCSCSYLPPFGRIIFFFLVMKHERNDKKGESAPVDLQSLNSLYTFIPFPDITYVGTLETDGRDHQGHTHTRARALRDKAACGHIPRKKNGNSIKVLLLLLLPVPAI